MPPGGAIGKSRWHDRYSLFRYSSLSYSWLSDSNPQEYWTEFSYQQSGSTDCLHFSEVVKFPKPQSAPDTPRLEALTRVIELLYLVAGTSYYKIAAPKVVEVPSLELHEDVEAYLLGVYSGGLGEFAYCNDLPWALRPELITTRAGTPVIPALAPISQCPLVPVGGGKDSVVSVELLRHADFDPTLFAVSLDVKQKPSADMRSEVKPKPAITQVFDVSGLPTLVAQRILDARLMGANRRGAYNGHIPVTAINSLVAVATAVLHGLGPVVMSNERSASSGNLIWHGQEINHQWSKGLDAERRLRRALAAHAGPGIGYFSLLRTFSELSIARLFARMSSYDQAFTSCNVVFPVDEPMPGWCGNCPKCRFVFLVMAPFMSRARLTAVFGKDMLQDESQLPGFRELVGVTGHKPFECVGEVDESLAALRLAAESSEWKEAVVIKRLTHEVPVARWPSDADVERALTPGGESFVPPGYARALHALD